MDNREEQGGDELEDARAGGDATGLSRKSNMSAPTRSRIGYMRAIASKSRIGRIRRAVRRAFILSGGKPILARDVLERSYPRLKIFLRGHRRAVWRALRMDAVVIGRMLRGRGRPALWAPRD